MQFVSPGSSLLSQVTVDTDLDMLNQNVDIGSGALLTANLAIMEESAEALKFRNHADTIYMGLVLQGLAPYASLLFQASAAAIASPGIDSSFTNILSRVNGTGWGQTARLSGGVAASFDLALARLTGALDCNGLNLVDRLVLAGDYVVFSADTERSEAGAAYVLKKEIEVGMAGVYRVTFDLKDSAGTQYCTGRIYKNGGVEGTERQISSNSYVNFSEDITLAKGDLVQLYIHTTVPNTGYCRNFRLGVDDDLACTVNTD